MFSLSETDTGRVLTLFPFFSQGVGRHDKKGVDDHAHQGRDRRTASEDRVDQVDRREHQADDGEDKRGLCLGGVLCRTAGENSFREGEDAHDEHGDSGHNHEAAGHSGAARRGAEPVWEERQDYSGCFFTLQPQLALRPLRRLMFSTSRSVPQTQRQRE